MNHIVNDVCIWNYTRGNTEYKGDLEYSMLKEELGEFGESRNKANAAKELADIVFVAVGSLYKLAGANHEKTQKILETVVEANFAKGTEKVDGKVQKGKAYVNPEPIIKEILQVEPDLWGSYLDNNKHIYG